MYVTLKPETLKILELSLHICSQIEEDITNISSQEKVYGQKQHKELKGRITTDAKGRESIRKKLDICIDSLDPGNNKCCEWPISCRFSKCRACYRTLF